LGQFNFVFKWGLQRELEEENQQAVTERVASEFRMNGRAVTITVSPQVYYRTE
jgi:hypothetical protein